MLKKGRKREAKGLAVLYFVIGLIILLIILAVIYFALVELDYSDRIKDPETTIRSYVETTLEPGAVATAVIPVAQEVDVPETVDLTEPTATPEPTPTPSPEPTATPEPTPEPTPIAPEKFAQPMTQVPELPAAASENGAIGITSCYVSTADNNKVMYMAGYGYVNVDTFDGAQARSWLIVTQKSSGQAIAYPLTTANGVSGLSHSSAVCQNATASDFEIYLDVSAYKEDIYSLALVIGYVQGEDAKPTYAYYPFSGDVSFTVLDGQVVTPVTAVDYE